MCCGFMAADDKQLLASLPVIWPASFPIKSLLHCTVVTVTEVSGKVETSRIKAHAMCVHIAGNYHF